MAHVRSMHHAEYPQNKTNENVINRKNNPVNLKKIVEKKAVLWYNSGSKKRPEDHHEAAFFC